MVSSYKALTLFIVAVLVAGLGLLYFYLEDQKIGTLTVDAGPRDGETYFLMQEIAEVVERNSEKMRLKVVSSPPLVQGEATRLKEGVQLTTVLSNTPPIPKTSLIATLYEEVFQIITRTDTGIYRIKDLDGKRLALPPHGTSELEYFWTIGDHYDLFVQNVEWTSMGEMDALNALLNDKVDALFFVGTTRNHATLKLIEEFELRVNAPDLRMLPIGQAPAMGVKRPYIQPFHIEKGTFDGSPPLPSRRLKTGAVLRYLVAESSANPDHVSELTRILFENRFDLSIRFPLANRITQPSLENGIGMPLHEGAERYYTRNEPSFVVEHAEPLALLVTVFAMLSSSLFALKTRFSATQKNRADHFNNEILQLSHSISSAQTVEELNAHKVLLKEMLQRAVKALDIDKVSDEGFQSFAFLWQTTERELDDRMSQLPAETDNRTPNSIAAE
ncbi:MAG: TAXI family TRAP transporter solute-binding subunit [Hyphomicrobiales bacterium]